MAILALYLASVPLHLEWVVIAAAAVALLVAAIPGLWAPLARAVTAAIRYGAVVKQLADVEGSLEEANKQVGALKVLAETRYSAGVKAGRKQLLGEVLGRLVKKTPTLIAIAGDAGNLKLIGQYEEGAVVRVGALFSAVVQMTGDKRGVVEVVAVDSESRRIQLTCVERTTEAFWAALEGRVEVDAKPPADIELRAIPWGAEFGLGNPAG